MCKSAPVIHTPYGKVLGLLQPPLLGPSAGFAGSAGTKRGARVAPSACNEMDCG